MTATRPARRGGEHGQAALTLVILLTIVIAVFGGILAETAIQHDPIVQKDTIDHYAYRALEAGINTFISKANDNPNLIACNSTSATGGQCKSDLYLKWKKSSGTSATTPIPEYYAWGNPRFCYTQVCRTPTHPTTPTPKTGTPVLYVKEAIYGAAGYGNRMSYQSSTVNVKPVNGFLTRIWWSRYEATDPALSPHYVPPPPTQCTYDYANGYRGPNITTATVCSPVVFAATTQVYGPIFSDDSIYITRYGGNPKLGPVATADPGCLFVTINRGCTTQVQQNSSPVVTQSPADLAANQQGATYERLPTYDTTLSVYAALQGCVYSGPTTFEFHANGTMTVWSKGTPERPASATKPECPSTHYLRTGVTTKVATPTTSRQTSFVPNGTHGNGVIYVETATTLRCVAGASPFDDYTAGKGANGPRAQYTSTGGTIHAAYFSAVKPDCEGDAFVSDAPTAGGIKGQLTVGASNDVVVTGTLQYTDCGTGFNSTVNYPCHLYTTGSKINDSLGLVAVNYVLVNHPVTSCSKYGCSTTLAPRCTTSVLGTPAAALCDPSRVTTSGGITIDAAVLALQHSFAVDNEGLPGSYGCRGAGGPDGTLKVYGSIDQQWRGAVGCVGGSGFTKDYDWNAEGAVITPPYYLAPGTPSWAIGSSAITVDKGPPAWCYTSTTPKNPVKTTYATTPACNSTA